MHFVFLIFADLFVTTANANKWLLHNHIEYYVFNEEKTFKKARTSCHMTHTKLVMIQVEHVQVFLVGLFNMNTFSSGN